MTKQSREGRTREPSRLARRLGGPARVAGRRERHSGSKAVTFSPGKRRASPHSRTSVTLRLHRARLECQHVAPASVRSRSNVPPGHRFQLPLSATPELLTRALEAPTRLENCGQRLTPVPTCPCVSLPWAQCRQPQRRKPLQLHSAITLGVACHPENQGSGQGWKGGRGTPARGSTACASFSRGGRWTEHCVLFLLF